ncbi:hypothetical protein C5N14_10410 [Micromonospora sp. MW-13]|uniref:hypothetical protein n=1 Tax=unclassified Micromonospora TaxID=2617518 RepID=UPI000E446F05|nr:MULTISPECIES: hypothetical protein [unclassified Micromonospora]MCX4468901.1 hypothetical protein [Micromonospora sp. NBC_01655]RGC68957.1 hypothetical protein C5N14_10410 [Micromonospora sp. MW-13]
MEQRKHWWNGKWGRLARRDVFLRVNGDQWHVEQRAGGAEGVSQFYEYPSVEEAEETVRALLAGADDWRELSPRPPGSWQPAPDARP